MVIVSKDIQKLQEAFNKLTAWATKNELQINEKKTVTMTFRKGGKPAASDVILYKREPLTVVPHFKYLGVTLQTRGNIYSLHVAERVTAATSALNCIPHFQKLSLTTALKLFKLKITPIMTYGLTIIWEHLTKTNLKQIENLKSRMLKKVLCVSKYTPSRLVYMLTKETFYIEDLKLDLSLPTSEAYQSLLKELQEKREHIWQEFYCTDAMINREWTKANYELRHIFTCFAVHGFHHRICKRDTYHTPDELCVCKLCDKPCNRYHAMTCSRLHSSAKVYLNREKLSPCTLCAPLSILLLLKCKHRTQSLCTLAEDW